MSHRAPSIVYLNMKHTVGCSSIQSNFKTPSNRSVHRKVSPWTFHYVCFSFVFFSYSSLLFALSNLLRSLFLFHIFHCFFSFPYLLLLSRRFLIRTFSYFLFLIPLISFCPSFPFSSSVLFLPNVAVLWQGALSVFGSTQFDSWFQHRLR